jgi:hypothetical protein
MQLLLKIYMPLLGFQGFALFNNIYETRNIDAKSDKIKFVLEA